MSMAPSHKARRSALVRAYEVMCKGEPLCREQLSELIHCDPKVAQRALWKLHRDDGFVYIFDWRREHGAPVPIYKIQGRRKCNDVPQPMPKSSLLKRRERRERPEVREKESAVKRWNRSIGKEVRLGMFGI